MPPLSAGKTSRTNHPLSCRYTADFSILAQIRTGFTPTSWPGVKLDAVVEHGSKTTIQEKGGE